MNECVNVQKSSTLGHRGALKEKRLKDYPPFLQLTRWIGLELCINKWKILNALIVMHYRAMRMMKLLM